VPILELVQGDAAGFIEKGNGLRLMLLALLNGQLMMDVHSITGFIISGVVKTNREH